MVSGQPRLFSLITYDLSLIPITQGSIKPTVFSLRVCTYIFLPESSCTLHFLHGHLLHMYVTSEVWMVIPCLCRIPHSSISRMTRHLMGPFDNLGNHMLRRDYFPQLDWTPSISRRKINYRKKQYLCKGYDSKSPVYIFV